MELNPNHPVTQEARDLWYKMCAALMLKLGLDSVEITLEDVQRLGDGKNCIVFHSHEDCIELKVVSMEEGERLARMNGGLPQ